MNPKHDEVRCKSCGALLAKVDETGLTIKRGDMQATVDGAFRATLVCYAPRCRSLNILNISTEREGSQARALATA
jgi:phage FluMu protein Com